MPHLQEKYTNNYFLKQDEDGNPTPYGVVGLEAYHEGAIRPQDKQLLDQLQFFNKHVLDIGFGRGEALKYAYDHGALTIVGTDFSEAAYKLAQEFLKQHDCHATLHCQDALSFLKTSLVQNTDELFDIVLLFDIVEHIPREELKQILLNLKPFLSPTAVIAINTPVFPVDNDVVTEGVKAEARDETDKYPETQGMHINRYTKQSLKIFLSECGYTHLYGHFFSLRHTVPSSALFKYSKLLTAFPFKPFSFFYKQAFEYVKAPKPSGLNKTRILVRHLAGNLLRFLKLKPPQTLPLPQPEWIEIQAGPLKGKKFFLDYCLKPNWDAVKEGRYESYLYKALSEYISLSSKVIWDIGAGCGYHSLGFAALTGPKGKVFAFEPDTLKLQKLLVNIERNNKDLTRRIIISDLALAEDNGFAEFIFSGEADDMALKNPQIYERSTKEKVRTVKADTLLARRKAYIPNVLHIDVEGAESMVLEGAMGILAKYHPLLAIKIHNISQMYFIQQLLGSLNYTIELVDTPTDSDSKAFIIAY